MLKPFLTPLIVASVTMVAACQPAGTHTEQAAETQAVVSDSKKVSPAKPDALISNDELIAHGEKAKAAASQLGEAMKAELIAAIEAEGHVGAIRVCSEVAPQLAADISAETGYNVSRTSLQTRNPANMPDWWDEESFDRFQTSNRNGFPFHEIERFQAIEAENGDVVFRYMKPIVMGDVCAACHGEEISEDVQAALDELYPEDQATGYAPGDLRGGFKVTKVLREK